MAIHLIRHGETDANAARVVQVPSVPLSARGREQAQRLGMRLASAGISAIVSSDLERAAETARAIAVATGVPIAFDPELAERNYGDVRGTAYADLREDIFAPAYEPPGGETWAAFHARVDAAWTRAVARAARTAGDLAVVTHGLVCARIFAAHLDPPPGQSIDATAWPNTCVTIVDGPARRTVRVLACTAHLDAVVGGARA